MAKSTKLKKRKGDIYAIPLPENRGYIYIYYMAGNNNYGDLITVFDYITEEIEKDTNKILSQKSLYEQNPCIGFIEPEEEGMILVGNVKPNFKKLMNKPIYIRVSIESNKFMKKYYKYAREGKDEWEYMYQDYLKGIRYICHDWDLIEYRITSERGKFDGIERKEIGDLPENLQYCFLKNLYPHYEDFINKALKGYDRNMLLHKMFI